MILFLLLAAIIIGTTLTLHKLILVPKELRSVPEVSLIAFLWSYLTGESPDVRYDRMFRPVLREKGLARIWTQGRWELIVSEPKLAKEILRRNDSFLKRNPNDDQSRLLLVRRMFGLTNIIISDGDDWRRHRRLVNSIFKLTFTPDQFMRVGNDMMSYLSARGKAPVPMLDLLRRVTVDAFGLVFLDYDFNALKLGESHYSVQNYAELLFAVANPIFFAFPELENWIPSRSRNHKMGYDYRAFMRSVMNHRIKEGFDDKEDLVSLLLKGTIDGTLTHEDVVDDLVAVIVAGHDTISNALTACYYYLAKHQDIQQRAFGEIIRTMGEAKYPTNESLKDMQYLECIIKEAMRLVTTVAQLRRYCHEEVKLSNGLVIPSETSIAIETWGILHDLDTYPDHNSFNPDRFLVQYGKEDKQWIPFGYGTRMCAGKNFALVEMRVLLVMTIRAFRFSLVPDAPRHTKFNPAGLVHPLDADLIFAPRN